MSIEEIYWHDGLFIGLKFGKSGEVELTCELFEDYQTSLRSEIKVLFFDVRSAHFTVDYFELIDNSKAGNIAYARYFEYKDGKSLRIHFVDGYLEVKAANISVA
jgi:hypothetical protein